MGRSSSCAPVEARSVLCSILPQFNNDSQQDAQELLLFLLNALHDDLIKVQLQLSHVHHHSPRTSMWQITTPTERVNLCVFVYVFQVAKRQKCSSMRQQRRAQNRNCATAAVESTIVTHMFEGQLSYMTLCMHCDHQAHSTQTFTVLSLPIPTDIIKCSIQVPCNSCRCLQLPTCNIKSIIQTVCMSYFRYWWSCSVLSHNSVFMLCRIACHCSSSRLPCQEASRCCVQYVG